MTEHTASNPNGSNEVRVAIIGVGNCASSLVQGVQYYQDCLLYTSDAADE